MWKLIILSFFTSCFCVTTVLKNGKKMDWGKNSKLMHKVDSALSCKAGEFVGMTKVFEVFEPVVEECTRGVDLTDTANFPKIGICYFNMMGLVDSNGAPNLPKIDAFVQTIFSFEILKNVPQLPREMHRCTKEYLYDYSNPMVNSTQEDVNENFSVFLNCFDVVSQKYQDEIKHVCKKAASTTS